MKLEEFLGNKDIETYFDEKLKECEYISELPRELKNCTCCERHRINFPIFGQKNTNVTKTKTKNVCTCPCRHIARHICREWD